MIIIVKIQYGKKNFNYNYTNLPNNNYNNKHEGDNYANRFVLSVQ